MNGWVLLAPLESASIRAEEFWVSKARVGNEEMVSTAKAGFSSILETGWGLSPRRTSHVSPNKHRRQSRVLWPTGGQFYYIKLCLNLNLITQRWFLKDFLWVLPYPSQLKTMMDKTTVQKKEVIDLWQWGREHIRLTTHGVSHKTKENYDRICWEGRG